MNTILMHVPNSAIAGIAKHRATTPKRGLNTRPQGYRWQQFCTGDDGGGQQQPRGARGDGAVQS